MKESISVKAKLHQLLQRHLCSLTVKGDLSSLKRHTRKALQSCVAVPELDLRLIHIAAENGHLDIVKFFVEEN